jgi:transcriptional regulator with XRE-family HTH domain
MAIAATLIDTLKRELRGRGMTYAQLAARIGMSEASVKRMFSQKNFTLERLEQILEAADLPFAELASAMHAPPPLVAQLTLDQERQIVADTKLFLVAVAALNHIDAGQMSTLYTLTPAEITACLTKLDRIGFLQLQPNNRIKLLVSRTFRWLPAGPIQTRVRELAADDYLQCRFDQEGQTMQLISVMLSKPSLAQLEARLRQVAEEFARVHQDEARLPFEQRQAVSFLLACRPWVPQAFEPFLRQPAGRKHRL